MKHTGFITQSVSDGKKDETFVLGEWLVMDALRTHSAGVFSESG